MYSKTSKMFGALLLSGICTCVLSQTRFGSLGPEFTLDGSPGATTWTIDTRPQQFSTGGFSSVSDMQLRGMSPNEFDMIQFSSPDQFLQGSQILQNPNRRRQFGGGMSDVIWQQSAIPFGSLSRTLNTPRWIQDSGTTQTFDSSRLGRNSDSFDFARLGQMSMFPSSSIRTSSVISNNFDNLFTNELPGVRTSLGRQRTGFQRPQNMENNLSRSTSTSRVAFGSQNDPSLMSNIRQRIGFNRQAMNDNSRSPDVLHTQNELHNIRNNSDVNILSASFDRFTQAQDRSRTSNMPSIESILRRNRPRNPIENNLNENRPRNSIESILRENRPRNSIENIISENRPRNSVENILSGNRPRNSVENILSGNRPRNSIENILSGNRPRNSVENILSGNRPRNSVENLLSGNRPRNSVESILSGNRPRNSVENILSETRPGNAMMDSLMDPSMNPTQNMRNMPRPSPLRRSDDATSNRFSDNLSQTDTSQLLAL
ncbi:uncharacterized protein LOC130047310 [Ostrea edulis]|uniref:uncharacterized protein LOC130047310 n=1 Tax=Ostrea edulis TaxID=37623 RepID=UPI0024AFB2F5|nr:uncharacterized protein LOC130047310 [Ostrea edulis]